MSSPATSEDPSGMTGCDKRSEHSKEVPDEEKTLGKQHPEASDLAKSLSQLNPIEERRLLCKIDLHVIPIMILFYLLSFLDRTNIGNAKLNGLTQDLKVDYYNYRIALTILFVPYIAAEIPANIVIKKLGANR